MNFLIRGTLLLMTQHMSSYKFKRFLDFVFLIDKKVLNPDSHRCVA